MSGVWSYNIILGILFSLFLGGGGMMWNRGVGFLYRGCCYKLVFSGWRDGIVGGLAGSGLGSWRG